MIEVEEAQRLVLEQAAALRPVRVSVGEALGCVLAEDVSSDRDSPPWDKSMVDGYAICSADLASGAAEFEILEEVVAGAVPAREVTPGRATRIMTGAPMPPGADAVVMIERTRCVSGDRVAIEDAPARPGQNILRQATAFRRGEALVKAGTTISPVDVGLLCEAGAATPPVIPRPRVSVLSTGNELVVPGKPAGPGEIYNSNGPMLAALAARGGATVLELGIARDEHDELREKIAAGLQADVLLLSGGVSAGVLDLVPSVLEELGVERVFHKVRMKPGKPIWFGVWRSKARRVLVFGLPGNPVGSLVGFELLVRPAIERLAGRRGTPPAKIRVRIGGGEFRQRGDRTTYYPAAGVSLDSRAPELPVATLLPWQGSADLRTLAAANLLAIFPPGERKYAAGDEADALRL